ncbi:MAG: hypothetical protein IKX65_09425 [Prevotella sp.]|nr:hypothetical protein [Prevotella sp.]
MKRIAYITTILCMLLACGPRKEYKESLQRVEAMMNDHPDSALQILDSLGQHEAEFNRHFRMQYLLNLTMAQAKTGYIFTNDSLTELLVRHFNTKGTKTEKTWAYYLYGCALSDIGHAPEALQAYYDAIDVVDTPKEFFDYTTLKSIYGQMSQIFHKQNLPHDEIWALNNYIDCVKHVDNEEEFIIAKSQLIKPYYLLDEKDSILNIIDKTYNSLIRLGKEQRAAACLVSSIYIFIERNQLTKAKEVINLYEQKSGLFDQEGNIVKGREGYYWIKGFYELAVKDMESAEAYFRKAIKYGYLSEGYRGLLRLYREKNNMDSVVLFSQLYEAAQDTLHNKMRTDAVHQMSVLYNYNRNLKKLEEEKEKVRNARIVTASIIVVSISLIWVISWLYYRKQKRRKDSIISLENELNSAISTRNELKEELGQLKAKDYENVIATKENKVTELTAIIKRLTEENRTYKSTTLNKDKDHLEDFLNSTIALLFVKKATGKTERTKPTETEWKMIVSQFSKDLPATFKSFGEGKPLSQLEQRICILLILDIPEYIISIMADTSTSTVSNTKARANYKLFGKKEAYPLKNNLIHSLRRS